MSSHSGIYRIDGPNGKFYVGSAQRLLRRWIEHKRDLRKGCHANPRLQSAWSKYGEKSFSFTVIEVVPEMGRLIEREQFWIDELEAVDEGYNVLRIADSRLGLKSSDETKRKQSAAHTGRKHGPMSQEQKAYFSKLYAGRKLSDETRRRMSEARRGKVFSEESRMKMSASHAGMKFSDEHRAKLAAAKLGRKQSPEHVAKRVLGTRLTNEAKNQSTA